MEQIHSSFHHSDFSVKIDYYNNNVTIPISQVGIKNLDSTIFDMLLSKKIPLQADVA